MAEFSTLAERVAAERCDVPRMFEKAGSDSIANIKTTPTTPSTSTNVKPLLMLYVSLSLEFWQSFFYSPMSIWDSEVVGCRLFVPNDWAPKQNDSSNAA